MPSFSAAVVQLCAGLGSSPSLRGGRLLSLFLDDPGRHPAVRHCCALLADVHADLPVFSFDSDSLLDPDLHLPGPSCGTLCEADIRKKIAGLVTAGRRDREGDRAGADPAAEEEESLFRDAVREHQQVSAEQELPHTT